MLLSRTILSKSFNVDIFNIQNITLIFLMQAKDVKYLFTLVSVMGRSTLIIYCDLGIFTAFTVIWGFTKNIQMDNIGHICVHLLN